MLTEDDIIRCRENIYTADCFPSMVRTLKEGDISVVDRISEWSIGDWFAWLYLMPFYQIIHLFIGFFVSFGAKTAPETYNGYVAAPDDLWYGMLHLDTHFYWNHPFISWIYGNDERMTDVSPREDAVLDFEAIHYPFWSRNDVLEKLAGEFWLYIILDILWAIQSFVTIYTPVYGFKWFLQWTL